MLRHSLRAIGSVSMRCGGPSATLRAANPIASRVLLGSGVGSSAATGTLVASPLSLVVRAATTAHALAARSVSRAGTSLAKSSLAPALKSAVAPAERLLLRRFASTEAVESVVATTQQQQQQAVPNAVRRWLAGCSAMVFGMIILGGVTRLTESGLSMVEWKPLTVLPPMSEAAWQAEFLNYQQYPEYIRMNKGMSLQEFKQIYFWEWAHRVWGRAIGVAFTVPLAYFAIRGQVRGSLLRNCVAITLGIGAQGALGWYMVKSGLEEPDTKYDTVRVSQYRLAAHFGAAALLYAGMLWTTLNLYLPESRTLPAASDLLSSDSFIAKQARKWFTQLSRGSKVVAAMVLTTAISGAFVAGLDAGLIYNEFPYMGGGLVPEGAWTRDTLALSTNSRSPDQLLPFLKFNLCDDSAAVQFNHRVLAISTATAVTALVVFQILRLRKALPTQTKIALHSMLAAVAAQVSLGIATLLYIVPTPLAATHQGGALVLLSTALWVLQELRRVRLPKL